ncbi:MAG: hypothetical protein WED15_09850 [Akkermansiaceae bacterium]
MRSKNIAIGSIAALLANPLVMADQSSESAHRGATVVLIVCPKSQVELTPEVETLLVGSPIQFLEQAELTPEAGHSAIEASFEKNSETEENTVYLDCDFSPREDFGEVADDQQHAAGIHGEGELAGLFPLSAEVTMAKTGGEAKTFVPTEGAINLGQNDKAALIEDKGFVDYSPDLETAVIEGKGSNARIFLR